MKVPRRVTREMNGLLSPTSETEESQEDAVRAHLPGYGGSPGGRMSESDHGGSWAPSCRRVNEGRAGRCTIQWPACAHTLSHTAGFHSTQMKNYILLKSIHEGEATHMTKSHDNTFKFILQYFPWLLAENRASDAHT